MADLFRIRLELPKKTRGSRSGRPTTRSKSLAAGGRGSGSINRSMISIPAPNSFRHVTHIGVGKDGEFEASSELDDSWKTMLANFRGYGASEETVIKHSDFVEGFWKGVEVVKTVDCDEPAVGKLLLIALQYMTRSLFSSHPESVQQEMNRKMTTISAI